MFDPVQYPYLLFKVVNGLLALQGWGQAPQVPTHQTLLLLLITLEVFHSFHARDAPVSQFISLYPSGLHRFAIQKDDDQVVIILRDGRCKAGSSGRRYPRFYTVNSLGPQKLLCVLPTVAPLISRCVSILHGTSRDLGYFIEFGWYNLPKLLVFHACTTQASYIKSSRTVT